MVAYVQGDQTVVFQEGAIPGLNTYEAQILRQVTINCPGPGTIVAQATGHITWLSTDQDIARIWFHPHNVSPYDWETPDYDNLRIFTDCNCADATDQYSPWSISKVYTVGSAGNLTVRVCADNPWMESHIEIGDVSMQLMFFPQ